MISFTSACLDCFSVLLNWRGHTPACKHAGHENMREWAGDCCDHQWANLRLLKIHEFNYHGGLYPTWSSFCIIPTYNVSTLCIYMYFDIPGCTEDSRYASLHLVLTFCGVLYVCCNKIFKNWKKWRNIKMSKSTLYPSAQNDL